ncbi:hypothetical protein CUJ83_04930 [Methanocella sp. CWC-04]|uniref:SprT-like family protein n=1 Tax=Methanooceanicella nereidis TaxID=2052831 RepID=A0AAP2W5Q3_9EURY|nr:hypothetical protein [Methanocella sp. CWC-04]
MQGSIRDSCKRLGSVHRGLAEGLTMHTMDFRLPVVEKLDRTFFKGKFCGTYGISVTTFVPFIRTPVILLNERWLSDYDLATNSLRRTMDCGWHPECDDVFDYLVFHEAAHTIYKNMSMNKKRHWKGFFRDRKNRSDIMDISGYSLVNAGECFCESVAAYYCGADHYRSNRFAAMARDLFF